MKSFLQSFFIIKGIFFELFSSYKRQIFVLILLGIFSGLFGGLTVAIFVPLISFVLKDGEIGSDFFSRLIVSIFSFLGMEPSVFAFLVLIVFFFIVKAAILLVFSYLNQNIINDYEYNTLTTLYTSFLRTNWSYLMEHKVGHLFNMFSSHLRSTTRLMSLASSIFLSFSNFLIYLAIALKLSFSATLVAVGLGGLIIFSSRFFVKKTREYAKVQVTLAQDMAHELNENIGGLKTIKALGVEQGVMQKALAIFYEMRRNIIHSTLFKKINSLSIEPLMILFIAILFGVFSSRPDFELGIFVILVYVFQKIFSYVDTTQELLHTTSGSLPPAQRLLDFKQEVLQNREEEGGGRRFKFEKELQFQNVTFTYPGRNHPVLDRINFAITRGEMLGIIGHSGAGKTTLVDLILRLFRPAEGRILIDDQNVAEVDIKEWRDKIGYVSQDMFLKNDTIYNNIKFYNESLTEADVARAAKTAYAYDFIQKLPNGFQSMVGERGIKLSAGERQRVILARVFARHPEILVLDEATSSLDNESESMIKKAIADSKGKITIIVIAHRLSTVMNSDKLIVLDKGKIVECGVPAELLKKKDSYFYKSYQIITA